MDGLKGSKKELITAIIDADKDLATEIVLSLAEKSSFIDAFTILLEPVLTELGELWFKNKLSLAQAFLAAKVAEDIFVEASRSKEFLAIRRRSKGNVVIGNIEDDFHSFGRKLVAIFLRLGGWEVYDLGNDVVAEDFVDKAVETKSRVIGVSAMIYNTAISVRSIRNEIDKRSLTGKIQLCVGGAIFNLQPELVNEVGADGTTDNAIKAPDLIHELHQRSLQYEW